MGSNYSTSATYSHGFPPRKKRKMRTSESNHFDKNYLIEGAEFWAEKHYRKDSYFFERSTKRRSRENFTEIYGKAPTEYGSRGVSCWAFSCASSPSRKERAVPVPSSQPLPPSSAPWSSPIQRNDAQSGGQLHGIRPAGIRSKYLPTFG